MTADPVNYFVPENLSCSSCSLKSKIRPGMRYEDTPCSICPLKKDVATQRKQIIRSNRSARLIGFVERLLSIAAHEKRKRILFLLLENPGLRDRQIADRLDLPRRNVSYHTRLIRDTLPELLEGKPYE